MDSISGIGKRRWESTESRNLEEAERETRTEERAEEEIKTEKQAEKEIRTEERAENEELENLVRRLKGDWKVKVTVNKSDGSTSSGKGKAKAVDLQSCKGIRSSMNLDVDGGQRYFEETLWGFDPYTRKVHSYAIKSDGSVHDHVGEWKDGDNLELHWEGIYEGKPAAEDFEYKFISPKEIHVHKVDKSEGQEVFVSEYVLRRWGSRLDFFAAAAFSAQIFCLFSYCR